MKPLKATLLIGLSSLLGMSCRESTEAPESVTQEAAPDPVELLAQKTCSTCHAFVEPDRLPTSGWKEVLPIMGYFIGKAEEGYIMEDEKVPGVKERIRTSFVFSQNSSITDEEWAAIVAYYEANSPETLEKVDQAVSPGIAQFSYEPHPWKGPSVGLTYLNYEGGVFKVGSSTRESHALLTITKDGRQLSSYEANTPVVDVLPVVDTTNNGQMDMVLQLGNIENIDLPTGQIAMRTDQMHTVIGPLQRPVDFAIQDFDNDGGTEILVAEFGKYLGGISLYHKKESLTRQGVFGLPGATRFELRDVNGDGLMDFYCLVSQWEESIYLFLNKGGLSFEIKRLLQLPAYAGLTHFELVDFDRDGDEDIICSNGDSGDFMPFYKPYHGVRIFENEGDLRFTERWFHSQQGAYGTVCHDFDGDGDVDFGSIGHLASWFGEDETGFLYFENTSTPDQPWSFKAHALTGVPDNCWILIDSADVDEDGDMDIILGANTTFVKPEMAERTLESWAERGGVISILRNNRN